MSIKVLHYGLSYNYGGIENIVYSWFKNKPDNIDFDFINDSDMPLAYEDEFKQGGCKVYKVDCRYTHPLKRYLQINEIIKKEKYDYLHMHVMNLDEIGPIIACNNSKKTKALVHCHGMVPKKNSFKEKILMNEFKFFSIWNNYECLSCSQMAGELMFKDRHFITIENGIDYQRFAYSKEKRDIIREKLKIKDNEKIIGHIGRYCVEKNYPFLISVVAKLMKKEKNAKLMLIGNICTNDMVLSMLKENNIFENTILVGMVKDTSDYYSAMDVFFMPSLAEGFPISLVEAQASGLNCVASANITKEIKIIDNIVYDDFNTDDNVRDLLFFLNDKKDRSLTTIDSKLDLKYTSKKMMNYYIQHTSN